MGVHDREGFSGQQDSLLSSPGVRKRIGRPMCAAHCTSTTPSHPSPRTFLGVCPPIPLLPFLALLLISPCMITYSPVCKICRSRSSARRAKDGGGGGVTGHHPLRPGGTGEGTECPAGPSEVRNLFFLLLLASPTEIKIV